MRCATSAARPIFASIVVVESMNERMDSEIGGWNIETEDTGPNSAGRLSKAVGFESQDQIFMCTSIRATGLLDR
jgi:hypothetical protein